MQTKQQLKQRVIHAVCYELILLIIGTPLLSLLLKANLLHTTVLWVIMSVISVFWNMLFNHYFEKIEKFQGWTQRTVAIRILHAIGFEGGLLIFTVPIIAWMMNLSLINALLLDIGLAMSIMVYTFIYQWCYDIIAERYMKKSASLSKMSKCK
ncbi:chlorhexidine efflux PACE transporter AceI [Acinetobacter puyangensis]|uniref:chlorhexidine efflux PACE transporter AceI n=1 Tax=Acinetobacter puyangensis TaxID=1096779 RepID=UPI003A4DC3A5